MSSSQTNSETTQKITPEDAASDVRRWLLEHHSGALGTINRDERMEGWPFLSVVPFALDEHGHPLLQMADIAQHTRNVKADARVSLLVQQPNLQDDPQRGWRITLLGKLAQVMPSEEEDVLARFSEHVPAAHDYAKQHDFRLYRLRLQRVRYIGGFGRICWVDAGALVREPHGAGLTEAAPAAMAHMNADHAASMVEMCEGRYGFKPARAEMVKIDRTGFMVRAHGPDRLVHFSFGKEIDADSLRVEIIGVLKRARAMRTEAK